MDGPLVCGLLWLLLCLVASAPPDPPLHSPLTTDWQGHGCDTADVSTHQSLRTRRQTNNNNKKKKPKSKPKPGTFSILGMHHESA